MRKEKILKKIFTAFTEIFVLSCKVSAHSSQTNKNNDPNETNEINQIDQTDQLNERNENMTSEDVTPEPSRIFFPLDRCLLNG
jgi:hypothetical protein